MLFAAGEAQAYATLIGGIACTVITGFFGLKIASRTKSTNADTAGKIDRSLSKIDAFEALFVEWQSEKHGREQAEARADRWHGEVIALRRQLTQAGIEPGADT